MSARALSVPPLVPFGRCFTGPGFVPRTHSALAPMALVGVPHRVAEVWRVTQCHHGRHWTPPSAFLRRGRWPCRPASHRPLDLLGTKSAAAGEVVAAVGGPLGQKWGRKVCGLGLSPDPTAQSPGARERRAYGHCRVVLARLRGARAGRRGGLPVAAPLVVPRPLCSPAWPV